MVRKSPYKHDVSGHYREGLWIEKYKRGEGRKPRIRSRPRRVVGKNMGKRDGPYTVKLFYANNPTQDFILDADNWDEAARKGFTRSKVAATPEKVRIRVVARQ